MAVDILMAVAGALSIYLGYRLFCDSVYQRSRVRHLVSGALLAVFGLAILIAGIRGIPAAARPDAHSSAERGSFKTPKSPIGVYRTATSTTAGRGSDDPLYGGLSVGPAAGLLPGLTSTDASSTERRRQLV
jgi:hypothetical protein